MLLDRLEGRPGAFELYAHPANDHEGQGHKELKALTSPKVKEKIKEKGIQLIRYMDIER